MGHDSTVLGQFLKLIPRHDFDTLAAAHHEGAPLRRMTRFSTLRRRPVKIGSGSATLHLQAAMATEAIML